MNPILRFLIGCIGFVVGVVVTAVLLVALLYIISEITDSRLIPRGPAWLIFPVIAGIGFFRAFYNFETMRTWKIFRMDTKFDRLKLTLSGVWVVGSMLYINGSRDFRSLDIFDINRWGRIETEATQLVLLPALLIFFGFPLLQKLLNWINSGK